MTGWHDASKASPGHEGDYLVAVGYFKDDGGKDVCYRIMHFIPGEGFDMPPFYWRKMPRLPKRFRGRVIGY